MSSSAQWFDISNDGWRRMNAGRPPYELIKELIQNVLDEDFKTASLNYKMIDDDFVVSVEDDVENGIINSALITTVFLTGKEESHLKRGRKGRGLKEFLSVCYKATVETVGKTINFCKDGKRIEYTNNRSCGTKLTAYIKGEGWDKKAIREINKYVKNVILYNGNEFKVNGKCIEKRSPMTAANATLTTQIIEGGIQRDVHKETVVDIYERNKGSKGLLFEMGIPVVYTDIPFDIDIHQRIPMNDNRNDVDSRYIDTLKIVVVKQISAVLTKRDLLGWALSGNDCIWNLPHSVRTDLTYIIMGGSSNTVLSSNKRYDDKAKQKGKEVFDTAGMNYRVREMMGRVVGTSEAVIKRIEQNTDPVNVILTEEERHFCKVHTEIAKKGLKKSIEFTVVEKDADTEGNWTEAFHSGHTISYNRLVVGNVRGISKTFFSDPFSEQAIDLLIHEAAHEKCDIHADKRYVDTCTKYGAKIAVFFLKSMAVKKPVQAVKRTPRVDGKTVKDALKIALQGYTIDPYRTLKEIYAAMGANTLGEKAGIRGILNRDCLDEGSTFERNSEGGKYRLRVA
jgi:hypothetical protein